MKPISLIIKAIGGLLVLITKTMILLFGLAMLSWGAFDLQSNSSEWPSVEGQVISAVENTSSSDSDSTDYKITYEYQLGAEKYTGSYIYFVARPLGEKITVYYDPASPGVSTHSPEEMKWQAFWALVFGLGCVGWVGWDVFKVFRGKRPEAAAPTEAS